jgi:hypothetical protein
MRTAPGRPPPACSGSRAPSRAAWWAALGRPRAGLPRLSGERAAGGRSQRARERAWEKARGQCVGSPRALSERTERLPQAYAALRPRARRGGAMASLLMATVAAPLRRWGRTPGGRGVGGRGVAGRQGRLPLSPPTRASAARGRAVWRAPSGGQEGAARAAAARWVASEAASPPAGAPAGVAGRQRRPVPQGRAVRRPGWRTSVPRFPRRAGVWRTRRRPVASTRCPPGIARRCARRTGRHGPVQRRGAGPQASRLSGPRPV